MGRGHDRRWVEETDPSAMGRGAWASGGLRTLVAFAVPTLRTSEADDDGRLPAGVSGARDGSNGGSAGGGALGTDAAYLGEGGGNLALRRGGGLLRSGG